MLLRKLLPCHATSHAILTQVPCNMRRLKLSKKKTGKYSSPISPSFGSFFKSLLVGYGAFGVQQTVGRLSKYGWASIQWRTSAKKKSNIAQSISEKTNIESDSRLRSFKCLINGCWLRLTINFSLFTSV